MKKSLLVAVFSVWVVCGMCANDTLTRARVYNFNVGDTFEYELYCRPLNQCNPYSHEYETVVITNKFYSLPGDTLFFERKRIKTTATVYDTLVISNLSGYEMFQDSATQGASYSFVLSSNYNNRQVNRVSFYWGNVVKRFAEGLGEVSDFHVVLDSFFTCDFEVGDSLIYYSKGSEVWGTSYRLFNDVSEIRHSQSEIRIAPNPATTHLTLQLQQTPAAQTVFTLFDITGRMVLQQPLTAATNNIDVSAVSKGMYLYNVVTAGEKAGAGKVIIE